jgi:hypothetical protein
LYSDIQVHETFWVKGRRKLALRNFRGYGYGVGFGPQSHGRVESVADVLGDFARRHRDHVEANLLLDAGRVAGEP